MLHFSFFWQLQQILLPSEMTEHVLPIDCIQIQYNAQRRFVFPTNILDSSLFCEIKASDWQNVGCATYLLSGHISKTSRKTKTRIFSQFCRLLIIVCYFSFYTSLSGSLSIYVGFGNVGLLIKALHSLVLTSSVLSWTVAHFHTAGN